MRGAAAGGSERKRAFRRAAPRQGRVNAGTNEAGSRRAHGLRPGSGPMQNGDRAVAHAGGRTCPGSDQTKRFISEKSKSFSISPSAEKV